MKTKNKNRKKNTPIRWLADYIRWFNDPRITHPKWKIVCLK